MVTPWEVGRCIIENNVKLTRNQKSIIIGTILGDGFLQKTGVKNARLRLEHSQTQRDYLLWKMEHLGRLFQGKLSELSRRHPKTKRLYHYSRVQSNSMPELGKIHRIFYQNGKKRIPDMLPELFNSLVMAVWYMDDGYYYKKDKNSFLYLGKVSIDEAKIAQRAIKKAFNIQTKIYDKKDKGLVIYFPVSETKKLHKIIKEHIIPLFSYKIRDDLD